MDVYDVADLAVRAGGEYVLGSRELRTHACYLVYGILRPGEKCRKLLPGKGHEEIVCIVRGNVLMRGTDGAFSMGPGQVFHLRGEETFTADNEGKEDAVYVISGGHSEVHRHQ